MDKYTMFSLYIRELRKIREEPVSDHEIRLMYSELLNEIQAGLSEWIEIGKEGFFIIGKNSNCYKKCDFYIIDTYVLPEYRRKHLASTAIRKYINTHKGKYCLEIINNNFVAKAFWLNFGKLHTIKDWHTYDYKCTPYWFGCK